MKIRDKEGIILNDPDHVSGGWKEYVEELNNKENKPLEDEIHLEESTEEDVQGPALVFSEFEVASNEL